MEEASTSTQSTDALRTRVEYGLRSLLQTAALFMHVVTRVPAPEVGFYNRLVLWNFVAKMMLIS